MMAADRSHSSRQRIRQIYAQTADDEPQTNQAQYLRITKIAFTEGGPVD